MNIRIGEKRANITRFETFNILYILLQIVLFWAYLVFL